ncbi:MAG: hypothetical protein IKZ46_01940 [Victivallales bacterium]|nr:hypothetical protein [Victivallales bacterium]
MNKSISERILCMFLVFITCFPFAVYAEETFDMKLLIDNVLMIHSRPVKIKENEWDETSLFKGSKAEKKEIENKCQQQITAMMKHIAETSDVAVLKPLLKDAWVFFYCIRDIVEEQEKLPPELNHKIMDFIVDNGAWSVTEYMQSAAVYYTMELLERQLPEANLSPAFLDYAVDRLVTGRISFWHYFLLPEATRKSMHPTLRKLSQELVPDGNHDSTQYKPLPATACLAFDGDEDAITKCCVYLDHIKLLPYDIYQAFAICALSKQRKVIDKIIHIMKTDTREIPFDGCVPPQAPRRAAAAALAMIDQNFLYTHKAWDMRHDTEMDACLEWLKTHEIDLKQPLYPKKINIRLCFK